VQPDLRDAPVAVLLQPGTDGFGENLAWAGLGV